MYRSIINKQRLNSFNQWCRELVDMYSVILDYIHLRESADQLIYLGYQGCSQDFCNVEASDRGVGQVPKARAWGRARDGGGGFRCGQSIPLVTGVRGVPGKILKI